MYKRSFAHGIAVLNVSARPYVYRLTDMSRITIKPNDGLVVEVRPTGFFTNVGK